MNISKLSNTKPDVATGKYGDVIGTIKAQLKKATTKNAVAIADIVKVLVTEHKLPKQQAYARVNNILQRAWFITDYEKMWGEDGHTYIARKK